MNSATAGVADGSLLDLGEDEKALGQGLVALVAANSRPVRRLSVTGPVS